MLLLNCEMVPKHQLKEKVQDGPIKGHLKAIKSHALHHNYHLNPPRQTLIQALAATLALERGHSSPIVHTEVKNQRFVLFSATLLANRCADILRHT